MSSPLNTKNSLMANYNQVNTLMRRVEREQTVKTFKQAEGNAIVDGRYAESRYGSLYSDPDGTQRLLIGQHPTDGHIIIAMTREDLNVIEELES